MSEKQFLEPILLLQRNKNPVLMKKLLTNLLKRGIYWNPFELYVSTWVTEHQYQPSPRWDWEEQDQRNVPVPNSGNLLKSKQFAGDYKKLRYYWALETLNRLKGRYIDEEIVHKRYKTVKRSPVLEELAKSSKNPRLNKLLAAAYANWSNEHDPSSMAWRRAYIKWFGDWVRIADHINLLYDLGELDQYPNTIDKAENLYAQKSMAVRIPTITQQTKNTIKKDYNQFRNNPNDEEWWDLALPYWNTDKLKYQMYERQKIQNQGLINNSPHLYMNAPHLLQSNPNNTNNNSTINNSTNNNSTIGVIQRPKDFLEDINKLNYFLFEYDADGNNQGLDAGDGGSDRYYSAKLKTLKRLYNNPSVQNPEITKWFEQFLQSRTDILKKDYYMDANSSDKYFYDNIYDKSEDLVLLQQTVNELIDRLKTNKSIEGFYGRIVELLQTHYENINIANGYPMSSGSDIAYHPLHLLHLANLQRNMRSIIYQLEKADPTGEFVRLFNEDYLKNNLLEDYMEPVIKDGKKTYSYVTKGEYKLIPFFSHDITPLGDVPPGAKDPFFYRYLTAREMNQYRTDIDKLYYDQDLTQPLCQISQLKYENPMTFTFLVDQSKASSCIIHIFRILNKAQEEFKKYFGGSLTRSMSYADKLKNKNWQLLGSKSIFIGAKNFRELDRVVKLTKVVDLKHPELKQEKPIFGYVCSELEGVEGLESTEIPPGVRIEFG